MENKSFFFKDSHLTMNFICKTNSLDLQGTKQIHQEWKSRIHNFIQNPLKRKKFHRQEASASCQVGESLEMLLSQKRGQKAFRVFLKSEFCEENLDFWFACQEFRTLESLEELTHKAAHIYEEFIRAESSTQVNLDFYTKEVISQNLQHPSPLCFVEAQKKIFSLMENGSFPRFIQSEQYKVLLDAASNSRDIAKHEKAQRIKTAGDLMQHGSTAINLHSDFYLLCKV